VIKHDVLKGHLENLRDSIPELRGVLLASNEGLPVAHSLSNGADPNRVAAMALSYEIDGRPLRSAALGNSGEIARSESPPKPRLGSIRMTYQMQCKYNTGTF
jgi:hypothetical protein